VRNMNKLCFYSPPYPGVKNYYDMIDAAVALGLSAVEGLCMYELETPDRDAAKRIRAYADRNGVTFPCFSVYASYAAECVENLKGFAEVASILGSPYLHHTIVGEFSEPEKVIPDREMLFEKGVSAVREIFDYAESIGVKAIYEEQGYIFNGVSGFGKFLDAVERDVGIVADFGNIYESEDDLLFFIRAYADKVVHAHIKDVVLKQENPDGSGLKTLDGKFMFDSKTGAGIVPIKEAIHLLKQAGYDGYYGLEFSAENTESMKADVKMLSSLL